MGSDLESSTENVENSGAERAANDDKTPLVVDLDGTLIDSDILVESAFALLGKSPLSIFALIFVLLTQGKAALKSYIADRSEIDVSVLPYNQAVLSLLQQAHADDRPLYLASASHKKYVKAVAEHLDIFADWFATGSDTNLSGDAKRDLLMEQCGEAGFDYIGNASADLSIWAVAQQCICVNASSSVKARLKTLSPTASYIETKPPRLRTWIKLLRIHQWAKNCLVFVPLVTSQAIYSSSVLYSIGAFFTFSLTASSIYIINDAIDLDADRKHPSKKGRPLAAGTISVFSAMLAVPALLSIALIGAWFINPIYFAVLLGYLSLTTAYTFSLKRKLLVDVVALASLYTIRVIGGAAAISVMVSEWLLAFSVFLFTSLALIKRYTELVLLFHEDLPDPTNRNYRKADLPIIAALAAAAGFNAVTVFALYVSDQDVQALYARPQLLWLICPMLLYWLGRALMLAHRRSMNDDPIVFALKDRNSRVTVFAAGIVMLLAMFELQIPGFQAGAASQ
ncbi:MAG: UbiA family prenyltransferase [Henriciella sp.]